VMQKFRVLLVEDEEGLVTTLGDLLHSEGYEVESTGSGDEAIRLAREKALDLIVLDVMLPDRDGFEVCRTLRDAGLSTPILMLTARAQTADRVSGLRLGADDYLTKPFDTMELLARMEALLRRVSSRSLGNSRSLCFGKLEVDFRTAEVRKEGQLVPMSAREFALLKYFLDNHGTALTRLQLLRDVWGYASGALTRTVDVHVSFLRQKLEDDAGNPKHLLTVRGIGYKFILIAQDQKPATVRSQ